MLAEVDRDTLGLNITRGPSKIVGKFLPRGYLRAVVNEGDEATFRVEIVYEGDRRLRVSKGRKILKPTFANG